MSHESQPRCGCAGPAREGASATPPACCPSPSAASSSETAAQRASALANAPWIDGAVASAIGPIPRARTAWTKADHRGEIAVRCALRRMTYTVPPGLYAVGSPTPDSPVFISANYKLSFDQLRRALAGVDGWVLVLDTKGVNVWCAAGKGTFGTAELVARIRATRLPDVVTNRKLILPQLGAPGVAAHAVRELSGFHTLFGPVRANDIPAYLAANFRATPAMRRVRFDLGDRLVLVPVELVMWGRFALGLAVVLFFAGGLHGGGYDWAPVFDRGLRAALLVLGALLAGAVVAPLLLPWLPGRALSVKGALLGLALAAVALLTRWVPWSRPGLWLEGAAWLLLAPAIAGFVTMNYTGATTYTSLSGVRREMRYAVPAEIAATAAGLGCWIASLFTA
jgi:acetyl-CoA decarbonylase/synthase complex subunit gamma